MLSTPISPTIDHLPSLCQPLSVSVLRTDFQTIHKRQWECFEFPIQYFAKHRLRSYKRFGNKIQYQLKQIHTHTHTFPKYYCFGKYNSHIERNGHTNSKSILYAWSMEEWHNNNNQNNNNNNNDSGSYEEATPHTHTHLYTHWISLGHWYDWEHSDFFVSCILRTWAYVLVWVYESYSILFVHVSDIKVKWPFASSSCLFYAIPLKRILCNRYSSNSRVSPHIFSCPCALLLLCSTYISFMLKMDIWDAIWWYFSSSYTFFSSPSSLFFHWVFNALILFPWACYISSDNKLIKVTA